MVAIPSSLLLAYTLAELMEGKSEFPACYKIYDDLIVHFHAQVATLEAATEQDINEAMTAIDAAAEDDATRDVAMGDVEEAEGRQKTVQEKEEVKVEIRKKREPEIEEGRKAAANVWITEMRFARRAEVSHMSSRCEESRTNARGYRGSNKLVQYSPKLAKPPTSHGRSTKPQVSLNYPSSDVTY